MEKNLKYIYIILFFIIFLSSCTQYITPIIGMDIEVRVLLMKYRILQVIPQDSYILTIGDKSSYTSGRLDIKYNKKGLFINDILVNAESIEVSGTRFFQANSNIYRGSFAIYKHNGQLCLINKLHLEEYLFSVIPSEVYPKWNMEALKAQAIASRTFTLFEINRNRKLMNKNYDLYSDTRSQMYKGVKTETPRTSQAVLQTSGQVLTYNGSIIKSYYSASIGGISAYGTEIGDNQPYLNSVRTSLIKNSSSYKWIARISLKNLQKKIKMKEKIKSVNISERTLSGRIKKIKITDHQGYSIDINGDTLRKEIGYSIMKSTLANLYIKDPNSLIIVGNGYGHGVGMGQWEAQEFAKQGKSYLEILNYFYKNINLLQIY